MVERGRVRVSWWGEQHHQRGRAYASTRSRSPRYTERCLLRSTSRANALTIQNFPTSVQELSSELTVLTFKLSNQIEPFYLQYSSHTDGHNSRYVDTTAVLRTLLWFFYCCGFCCNSGGGRGNCRGCALHSHGTCRRRVGRTAGEGMEAVRTDNTSDVMRAQRACFCFPKALEASNIDMQGCRSRSPYIARFVRYYKRETVCYTFDTVAALA